MRKKLTTIVMIFAALVLLTACGKHKHAPGEWTVKKEATCSENGLRQKFCTSCGELLEAEQIPTPGHTYGGWTTVEEPSFTKQGLREHSCACGYTESEIIPIPNPQTLGIDLPVIYISDYDASAKPLTQLEKKDGEITVKYQYVSNSDDIDDFECFCEIKIQGASSSVYPKKNFTVKFYKDDSLDSKKKVDLGWGKESKYCMKANYIDSSQSRNIIGAKLFSQIVATRDTINAGLLTAPNYGVIDGYPVLVYVNGEFHGIYTMNIPKDSWTFGMEGEEESREALLMADSWTDSVRLKEEIGESYTDSGWEVEHCSTEDDSWIRESFNQLITLINCGDNERIKRELANHLDIEAAIDNMLFTYTISAHDNLAKNILWATYDGTVWIPSMYDMDGSFGIHWNGQPWGTSSPEPATPLYLNLSSSGEAPGNNKLYTALITCYLSEVKARWAELRQSVLSLQNVTNTFDGFLSLIPEAVYAADFEKWEGIPYAEINVTNMYAAVEEQLARVDTFINSLGS